MQAAVVVLSWFFCISANAAAAADNVDDGSDTISEREIDMAYSHLTKYGYIKEPGEGESTQDNHTNITVNALKKFQELYKLPSDGRLNAETLQLMSRPRCGNIDDPAAYMTHRYKWTKQTLIYYISNMHDLHILQMTDKAFQVWANHTNLKFKYSSRNPDILISFHTRKHEFASPPYPQCAFEFDGLGNVLAHAYFPSRDQNVVEMHIDWEERWHVADANAPPPGYSSYFQVVLHEIGHTLGLRHSSDENALMFPYYNSNMITLHEDDIAGIRALYPSDTAGTPSPENKTYHLSTRIKTTTPTLKTTTRKTIKPPDLCTIQIEHFLILNKRLYMFYEHWVWISALNSSKVEPAKNLLEWLTFLPASFKRLEAVYQKPNGDVVFFSGGRIYIVQFPSLQLLPGWPQPYSHFTIPNSHKVNAAVNTYTGRTLIYHGSNELLDLDDCSHRPKNRLIYAETFPDIPAKITSIFKYMDGYLYFITGNKFHKYSEYTGRVIQSGDIDLSLFNIHCANKGVLEQLYNVLAKLLKFDKHIELYMRH
uniref:Peptidase metallopeptidase domain-containing protein n=1 Tax=Photinus pyralis TaxID=7054 RepID=A0A1Y1L8M9_PHOPY